MSTALLPWGLEQIDLVLREDITWLVEAGRRMMHGGRLVSDIYEINLPLSIFLYFPLAIGVEIYYESLPYTFFFYTLFMAGLSAFLTNTILKRYGILRTSERVVFISGFILSCTMFTKWYEFGQREHFIFMGITPLILLQLSMTFYPHTRHGREFWPVIILGSIAMLIKPHYGVIAVVLMITRMIRQQRLFVLFDRDFLTLAIMTSAYALGMLILLPSYVFNEIPNIAKLYTGIGHISLIFKSAIPFLELLGIMSVAAYVIPYRRTIKLLIAAMITISLLCLMAYLSQMKGFNYHLFPAKCFAFCAFSLMVCGLQNFKIPVLKSPLTGLLLLISMIYIQQPATPMLMTHNDYKNLPLTKKVADCGYDCRFFMYVYSVNVSYTTAYYAHQIHMSRFNDLTIPVGIFIEYKGLKSETSRLSKDELDHLLVYYVRMFVEDIRKEKPDHIFICQDCIPDPFLDFFFMMGHDPTFSEEWKHYSEVETFTVDRSVYYTDAKTGEMPTPLTFKRYSRIPQ